MIYYNTETFETKFIEDANQDSISAPWVARPPMPTYDPETELEPWWSLNQWISRPKIIEPRKIWPSSADFWAAFTDSEKLAILASAIAGIILLREELRLWAGEVWSDDPRVQAGLSGLVAVGILTPERKAAILDP
jgi:hypothetical protein